MFYVSGEEVNVLGAVGEQDGGPRLLKLNGCFMMLQWIYQRGLNVNSIINSFYFVSRRRTLGRLYHSSNRSALY